MPGGQMEPIRQILTITIHCPINVPDEEEVQI